MYVYPNPNGSSPPSSAVTGGKVYRGTAVANTALQGYYLASDFYSGNIYKIRSDGIVFVENAVLTSIADFVMAENGELYAVSLNGTVYSINVGSVLPLFLAQFTGTLHNGVAQLNWKTYRNKGFSNLMSNTAQMVIGLSEPVLFRQKILPQVLPMNLITLLIIAPRSIID